MLNFYITIEGRIESEELYKALECYNVNMLDMGYQTVINGCVSDHSLLRIIVLCRKYGKLEVTID